MQKPTNPGMNRTGIATSPIDSPALIRAAADGSSDAGLNGALLRAERANYARQASPVGTVPPPASVKGMAKSVLERLRGHTPAVFIDKLGQRLAFERTGVRLYESLLVKLEGADPQPGGPSREAIELIRAEEHSHVAILTEAIAYLGADPTAMTPGADVTGVASLGWVQVMSDPRTTLNQCLDVMLAVELADADGWMILIELASSLGFDDLAERFTEVSAREEEHAFKMRDWVIRAIVGEAGV